jgi:hypothetical protein
MMPAKESENEMPWCLAYNQMIWQSGRERERERERERVCVCVDTQWS